MTGPDPGDPERINLNPGPVPLAEPTRQALLGELVSHRSPEFEELYRDCRERLRTVFRTENELVVVNGNGNQGLELAVANCFHPADRVLCLQNGKFGDNLEDLVSRHADDVQVIDVGWGQPFDLDAVEEAFDASIDAVVMTHCETSTGMLNPAKEVARLAADHGALSLIDGVSSIGGEPLPVDDWGIDLTVVASQKCLSAPPGLSAVSFSDDAVARWEENPRTMPYNLDLGRYRRAASVDQTPSTAPVPVYRALRQSLTDVLAVGLAETVSRQAERAAALRQAGTALGFEVFPQPNDASGVSNTVTVLEVPEPFTGPELVSTLEERGLLVRTGIGPMEEGTIRIATMTNALSNADVVEAIDRLRAVIADGGQGGPLDVNAVEAAQDRLR